MIKKLVEMETLFKALGDATRLRILGLLLTGEICVCDIHESLKIPQPKASRHLAYLRRSGLVETRRDERQTLIAVREEDGYRFDVRLQGPDETVFFDL